MKDIVFMIGTNIYEFFFIPTIRYFEGFDRELTVEWLKWYIGIRWHKE
jgi:hypothetical protein